MYYDVHEQVFVTCARMAPMVLDKLLIIACGIMVLLTTASATQEEKRSTEQLKHAPLEHAQLISNDKTLKMTVSGAHARIGTIACAHARVHARTHARTPARTHAHRHAHAHPCRKHTQDRQLRRGPACMPLHSR